MQITDLKQKGKSEGYYVKFDDDIVYLLQLETIVKHHLKVGSELNEEEFFDIKNESDKLTCFSVALKYISLRLKTEKQMKEYLQKKGFGEQSILLAIQKLKDYGYLNDDYFAKTLTQTLSLNKGKRFIKQDLLKKGINYQKLDNYVEDLDESLACKEVYQKWIKNKKLPLEIKDKEKLYRFLMSRGFEWDTIKNVINYEE